MVYGCVVCDTLKSDFQHYVCVYSPETGFHTVEYNPQDLETLDLKQYTIGYFTDYVWAKVRGYPWWPAHVHYTYVNGVRSGHPLAAFFGSEQM